MTPGQGLDKNILKLGIKRANNAVKNMTNEEEAWEKWVDILAETIDLYVKSGKIITVGSATTQTGTIT